MVTVRDLALMVLTLVVSCRGFVVTPRARRWRPNARRGGIGDTATESRLNWRSGAAGGAAAPGPGGVEMSIREMIGADVETGGLFDPLVDAVLLLTVVPACLSKLKLLALTDEDGEDHPDRNDASVLSNGSRTAGFSKDEPALFRRRAVELKHGRVSMIAVTGIVVQSFVRFPGFPPFPVSDVARPLAVLKGLWSADMESVLLALLAVGIVELTIGKQDYVDRAPGELGDFGAFAKPVDRDEWDKIQMAELKHGRLAMLGVVGCLAQELVTGEGPLEQISKGNINFHPFS